MSDEKPGPRRMINIVELRKIVPLARSTIFNMEKAGRFPKSKYITPARRVWFEDDIIHWQEHELVETEKRRRAPRRKSDK
jgi:predicted DNA-binding transcriptional regulator AlpA